MASDGGFQLILDLARYFLDPEFRVFPETLPPLFKVRDRLLPFPILFRVRREAISETRE